VFWTLKQSVIRPSFCFTFFALKVANVVTLITHILLLIVWLQCVTKCSVDKVCTRFCFFFADCLSFCSIIFNWFFNANNVHFCSMHSRGKCRPHPEFSSLSLGLIVPSVVYISLIRPNKLYLCRLVSSRNVIIVNFDTVFDVQNDLAYIPEFSSLLLVLVCLRRCPYFRIIMFRLRIVFSYSPVILTRAWYFGILLQNTVVTHNSILQQNAKIPSTCL